MKKITLKKQSLHLVPKDESQFAIDYKNES